MLWIDCDILVFRNVLEIAQELQGTPLIAGALDTGVKVVANDTPLETLSQSNLPYLNAGFLWMNLERMRQENFGPRLRQFISVHQDSLRFHDQTALNSFVGADREVLPAHHNYLCAPWYRDNSSLF